MITPSNLILSKDKKLLTVTFENIDYSLSSEFLRVYSPSAEVQGHGPGQETLQLNKSNVKIEKLSPMGNYAVAIHYDDGHSTYFNNNFVNFVKIPTHIDLIKINTLLAKIIFKTYR